VSGTGLLLVASAPTPALRHAVFGVDDDLDSGGRRAALVLVDPSDGPAPLGRAVAVSSPARAALQTATAAGREAAVDAALADTAFGRWTGRSLGDVIDAEPDAVQSWLTDPGAAPHGGESFTDVVTRVGAWLDTQAGDDDRRLVAFTHPVVVRAALVHALGLPPVTFRQLDVAPLSVTRLRYRSGRWTLHLPPAG
jgi:broad specificity phosphatase PhoE